MTPELLKQVKAARRVSVPLMTIVTPDPVATVAAILPICGPEGDEQQPALVWDVVRGVRALNKAGEPALAAFINNGFDATVGNPASLLTLSLGLPKRAIVFMHLAHRFWDDVGVVQAACNLRDAFKADGRAVMLLATTAGHLPAELAGDVVVLDEPLPDPKALTEIVEQVHKDAQLTIDAKTMPRAVEAIQGLPAFQAEQVTAMSMGRNSLDLDSLWERKRKQIELTPGLRVQRDDVRFEDVGGVLVVKEFLKRILAGKARPNAVVFVDEIEKALAGSSGGTADTSGVSQDQLGQLLTFMQDEAAVGCIFVGPPGSAKSMVAKATGNEAGIPTIALDLGGMKGSLVGQSEQNLRQALKVIKSVSNGRMLVIATCNSIADLPPELRRRFTLGTFFFDLPTADERKDIWKLWLGKLGLTAKPKEMPADEGWTGAEIRQCCDIAWRLGCTLKEAAVFVVPVSKSASEQLERLRKAAEGRFLSASRLGVYARNAALAEPVSNGRMIHRGED